MCLQIKVAIILRAVSKALDHYLPPMSLNGEKIIYLEEYFYSFHTTI